MSTNDKTIRIGIETKANTTGAKAASDSLDGVKDKAQQAGAALKETDGGSMKKLPADARLAAGSIDALESEVRQLLAELNKLPVGSQQFVTMAGRVKQAQVNLSLAQAEATKLAGVVGRRGNAGMAILELSRGLEDAQYGVRGLLNNIPGLIAMLGGGAGLAGAVSILAVTGNLLWEALSKGSKDAKKDTTDWLELIKKVSAEFGNQALLIEEARGKSFDRLLEDQKNFATEQQRIAEAGGKLASDRIKGDGGVAIAQARYDLAKVEADLVTATGDKAISLAKDRESIIKRIADLEKGIVESIREQELAVAQSKVNNAQGNFAEADSLKTSAATAAVNARQVSDAAGKLLADVTAERAKTIQALIMERDAMRVKLGTTNDPMDVIDLNMAISKLQEGIDAAFNPGKLGAQLTVEAGNASAASKQANENFNEAAAKQQDAAAALKAAAEELKNLQLSQGQQRKNEGQLKAISDTANLDDKVREVQDESREGVNKIVDGVRAELGDAANRPEVKAMIDQVRALAADGVQPGEENELYNIVGALVRKIESHGKQTNGYMSQLINVVEGAVRAQGNFQSQIDEIKRYQKTQDQGIRAAMNRPR